VFLRAAGRNIGVGLRGPKTSNIPVEHGRKEVTEERKITGKVVSEKCRKGPRQSENKKRLPAVSKKLALRPVKKGEERLLLSRKRIVSRISKEKKKGGGLERPPSSKEEMPRDRWRPRKNTQRRGEESSSFGRGEKERGDAFTKKNFLAKRKGRETDQRLESNARQGQ